MFIGLGLAFLSCFVGNQFSVPIDNTGNYYQQTASLLQYEDGVSNPVYSDYLMQYCCTFDKDFYDWYEGDGLLPSKLRYNGDTITYLNLDFTNSDIITQSGQRKFVFYYDRPSNTSFNFQLKVSMYIINDSDNVINCDSPMVINYSLPQTNVQPSGISISYPSDFDLQYIGVNYEFQIYDENTYRALSLGSGYDTGYDNGYADGHRDGWQSGYDTGADNSYSEQQEEWYTNGYIDGYNEGLNTDASMVLIFANIFQFAMIPVNFFLKIFNVEVFGINVSGLVSALLTMSIIVILLKTILGNQSGGE